MSAHRKRLIFSILSIFVLCLIAACGKQKDTSFNTLLPAPSANLSTGKEADFANEPPAVSDLLTQNNPLIDRDNVSKLRVQYQIGEGTFQDQFAQSPDGSSLAVLTGGGILFVDTATWERDGFHALSGIPESIAYSADGREIAVIYAVEQSVGEPAVSLINPYEIRLRILNAETSQSRIDIKLTENGCAADLAWNLAYSPDSGKIAYWGINSHSYPEQTDNLCVISGKDASLIARIAVPANSRSYTHPLFFNQDGSKIIAVTADQHAQWMVLTEADLSGTGSLRSFPAGIGVISDIDYDAQKNFAYLAGEQGSAVISLADFSHQEHGEIAGLEAEKISYDNDRKLLALSAKNGYYLFDDTYQKIWGPTAKPDNVALGRKQLLSQKVERTNQLAFDLKNAFLLILHNNFAIDDDFIEIIDLKTGREVGRVYGQNPAARFDISPDNQLAAIAGFGNGDVQIWSIQESRKLMDLRGHAGMVYEVVFSPDGQTIATASADATVKLWDSQTGALLRTFAEHSEPVWTVAFSNSGDRLYSAGDENRLLVWDVNSGSLESRFEIPGSSQQHRRLALKPDGRSILIASSCYSVVDCSVPWTIGELLEMDLGDGKVLNKFAFATREITISSNAEVYAGVFINIPEITNFTGMPFKGINQVQSYRASSGNGFLYGSGMSPDGELFLGLTGKELIVWEVGAHQVISTIKTDLIGNIQFAQNQKSFWVMGSNLGTLVGWTVPVS